MIKNNHDGTITLLDVWTTCSACDKQVTGDSIHTCSPQNELKRFCASCTTYKPSNEVFLINTSNKKIRIWKCIHCINKKYKNLSK